MHQDHLPFNPLPAWRWEYATSVRFRRLRFENSLIKGDPASYHNHFDTPRHVILRVLSQELEAQLAEHAGSSRVWLWLLGDALPFRLTGFELYHVLDATDQALASTVLVHKSTMYEIDARTLQVWVAHAIQGSQI